MRSRARSIASRGILVGVLLAALCASVEASSTTAEPPGASAWMPDVRQRLEDLRKRTRRATAEARSRREQQRQSGQAWRLVAAQPAPEVSR